MKCRDVACIVLLPSLLLSLVTIGICALFIYLHLLQVLPLFSRQNDEMIKICFFSNFQEYHAEIDKLKLELQAARDKDGVFLPKDVYDQQMKAKESADTEIRELTLNLKGVEEQLEKFKVRRLFQRAYYFRKVVISILWCQEKEESLEVANSIIAVVTNR